MWKKVDSGNWANPILNLGGNLPTIRTAAELHPLYNIPEGKPGVSGNRFQDPTVSAIHVLDLLCKLR